MLFDCSQGELTNSVWLGPLREPRPQFVVDSNFKCLKYGGDRARRLIKIPHENRKNRWEENISGPTWTCFVAFSGIFWAFVFKDIYWLTGKFHRRKSCLPIESEIFCRNQPMGFWRCSSQRHLLSLRANSEPVKNCQKPLESLSGNFDRFNISS